MRKLFVAGVATLASLGLGFLAATPTFADPVGPAKEPSSTLTIDYISTPTVSGTTYTYTVKVSGLTMTSAKSGDTNYVGFRYGNLPEPGPGHNGDDRGTQVKGTFLVTNAGSEVFTVIITAKTPPSGQPLDVAEYSTGPKSPGETDGTENQQESPGVVLPGQTPYGQLPEVPWAVGLPAVGLGAAVLLKRRVAR